MGAKGFVIAEEGHIVNLVPAVNITGGVTGQVFNMKNHAHVSILIQIGVSAAAFTKIIVNECTDIGGDGPVAIPFALYAQETAGAVNDVLGARQQIASAGYTPSANDGIFYVIELDASELDQGFDYVQLSLTNGSNSVIANAVAILSGARFAKVSSATATT
jgi:hypothetical protein